MSYLLPDGDLTPYDVLKKLAQGNQDYVGARGKFGDISAQRRLDVVKV
jgi:hypothetical protein